MSDQKKIPKPKKVTVVTGNQNGDQSFLDYFKSLHDEKDIDSIADTLWSLITMYGLDMSEVAALTFYIMERTLKTPANQKILIEDLMIDITTPTYHSGGVITPTQKVLDVQRALISKFVGELKGGSK